MNQLRNLVRSAITPSPWFVFHAEKALPRAAWRRRLHYGKGVAQCYPSTDVIWPLRLVKAALSKARSDQQHSVTERQRH